MQPLPGEMHLLHVVQPHQLTMANLVITVQAALQLVVERLQKSTERYAGHVLPVPGGP